jgi:hypothetical protein
MWPTQIIWESFFIKLRLVKSFLQKKKIQMLNSTALNKFRLVSYVCIFSHFAASTYKKRFKGRSWICTVHWAILVPLVFGFGSGMEHTVEHVSMLCTLFSAIFANFRCFSAIFDDFRQFLMIFDDFRGFLTIFDDFWQFSTIFDDFHDFRRFRRLWRFS